MLVVEQPWLLEWREMISTEKELQKNSGMD